MFRGYFDEGGTHQGSKVMSFAGFIATIEQWDEFDREWRELLEQYKLTHFHMTDFESGFGEFRDWDRNKRITCFKRFSGIINRRVNIGISFSVNLDDYREVIVDEKEKDFFGNPYVFCIAGCVRAVQAWAEKYGRTEPISYVFENTSDLRGRIMEFMTAAKKSQNAPHFEGSWIFGEKKELTPLQAADIFAYESWKQCFNKYVSEKKRPVRKSLLRLLERNHFSAYAGRDVLIEMKHTLMQMTESDKT